MATDLSVLDHMWRKLEVQIRLGICQSGDEGGDGYGDDHAYPSIVALRVRDCDIR
jgi:hypothetical protein